MAEMKEKDDTKKTAKKAAAARFTYGDVVKSNEEVLRQIAELREMISSRPPVPAQAPEQAPVLAPADNREVLERLDALSSRISPGLTPEQAEELRTAAAAGRMVGEAIAAQNARIESLASGLSPGLTPEQAEDLRAAASAAERITEAIAEQNARIDSLAVSAAPAGPEPSDAAPYLTSREQFDIYNKIISRRDAEFADRQFMTLLEQVCSVREDFRRLVAGMEQNIGNMKAADVLNSFKAYMVDLENMLKDAGVRYGSFGTQGQKADANLQRLVGVVETDDPSKDGTVAKRLSSGYEYKGRAVYKERVMVYRYRQQ